MVESSSVGYCLCGTVNYPYQQIARFGKSNPTLMVAGKCGDGQTCIERANALLALKSWMLEAGAPRARTPICFSSAIKSHRTADDTT
jgi:hypothetical protein